MISLHAYLTPKEGNEEALESAIRDKWIAAMAEQPGFSSAVMLTPFPDEELTKLNAPQAPEHIRGRLILAVGERPQGVGRSADPRPGLLAGRGRGR